MTQYFLRTKSGKVHFQLPETWSVLNNIVLEPTKPRGSVSEMTKEALAHPVGTPPLSRLIKATDKVAIIVDDFTRPTPKAPILNCIVEHLRALGLDDDQLDVVFAVGTHRPVTGDEAAQVLGGLSGKVRWTSHDCRAKDLVPVGTAPICGELKVNPLVSRADFRIAVGSVMGHPMVGFGGGPKAILPGVADIDTIKRHHLSTFLPRFYLGEATSHPARDGIRNAARLAKLNFIVNAVYNAEQQVMAIVAGDWEEAHQAGVAMSLKEYGVEVETKTDVTIVSTFPYDEAAQIMKPFIPAAIVTKRRGAIIVYAAEVGGGRLPEDMLDAFDGVWACVGPDPRKTALDCIREQRLIIEDGPIDLNAAAFISILLLSQLRVILVSPVITAEQAGRLRFDHAPTIEEAIRKAADKTPRATVNILPSGGAVLPLVKEKFFFE